MALNPRPLRGRRAATRAAWLLLVLALRAAAAAGVSWRRKAADNAAIAAGTVLARPEPAAGEPLEVAALRFARAHELARNGDTEGALRRYRSLHGDAELGLAARYNSANLLMRQAAVLRDSPSPGQAIPLVELAKQGYRDVLRAEPSQWDARYNYERAQRLQPDPDESDPAIGGPRNDAERAATTMRGIAPGLP